MAMVSNHLMGARHLERGWDRTTMIEDIFMNLKSHWSTIFLQLKVKKNFHGGRCWNVLVRES